MQMGPVRASTLQRQQAEQLELETDISRHQVDRLLDSVNQEACMPNKFLVQTLSIVWVKMWSQSRYQFWGRSSDQVPEGFFFSHCKLFFPVQIIPCGFEGTLLGLATPIRVTGSGRKTQCRLYLASYSCGLHGKGLFGSCFDTYADTTVPFPRELLQFWIFLHLKMWLLPRFFQSC